MKILIGTNCLTEVDSQVYGNHIAFYTASLKKYGKDLQLVLYTPRRLGIDYMRNQAAKLALESECDYLMFIDDDVLVQPKTLESLINADKDIVMALTYIRGYPFPPMFFKRVEPMTEFNLTHYDDFKDHIDENGLVTCQAVGFSCVLIKTSILKDLEPPYFITGPYHTEDVYFCCKAQMELQYEISIAVDTKVPTGHIMEPTIVSDYNWERLRTFYSEDNLQKPNTGDRGDDYINSCLEAIVKK